MSLSITPLVCPAAVTFKSDPAGEAVFTLAFCMSGHEQKQVERNYLAKMFPRYSVEEVNERIWMCSQRSRRGELVKQCLRDQQLPSQGEKSTNCVEAGAHDRTDA
ncbi:unnamed protein product [Strongylus vulgaris]|uniref:Uncharacterized protein n=1 Tax=Strongylus vulgaris TaxID=40348 RepID=A0A3P7LY37_STRVU|nr:unnamed protein product [Strongylus vulgaris]